MFKSALLNEIDARGFLNQCTGIEDFDDRLSSGEIFTIYAGFDCTADSLHVGNMMTIMLLRLFRKHGHQIVPLIGTATTQIGDPSGKDSLRPLLDNDQIDHNAAGIRKSLERILGNCTIMFNGEWTQTLNLVDFLRDVGRRVSVSTLLSLDSNSRRLENGGLTFQEFSYSLFQANDFLQLNKLHGVNIQIGGSDQWGNITCGTELVRKSLNQTVFGLTHPLITDSQGNKFGKSAGNAIWLNEDKLSAFEFWQFWRNVNDEDVIRLANIFTDLKPNSLCDMNINDAKIILATEVTKIVRGEEAAVHAEWQAREIFSGNSGNIDSLPKFVCKLPETLIDVLVNSGMCESKSAARRMITQKGIRVDDMVVTNPDMILNVSKDQWKISKGKKNHICVENDRLF